ncbi:hypothetical protein [Halorubrum yunnanense]|uniref:PGF-CTERM protein n=1 Tax=Halorubrum yunnanense TaxID=1526162 RepID=A0ABD5YFN5_9EURY|nr:hypothetical protein [Halorubrum yunnanense]
MTDSSFTLLEIHLGDGDVEVGPFEIFGAGDEPAAGVEPIVAANGDTEGDDDATDAVDAADAESDGGCRARSVAGLLLVLAALAAIAVGVVALRGDDEVPAGIAGDD